MQLKCIGNNDWELENSNLCRSCIEDSDCIRIKKGNKCSGGVCYKELLLVGMSQEGTNKSLDLTLFDPTHMKTENCAIHQTEVYLDNSKMQVIKNVIHVCRENGECFKLIENKWKKIGGILTPRKWYAGTVLKDGRWVISGGESVHQFNTIGTTEVLTNTGNYLILSQHVNAAFGTYQGNKRGDGKHLCALT